MPIQCPKIADLPHPPPGKAGWPWTGESTQLPDRMPNGSHWPKISIVTPSLNQGVFIEETIRSVLLQGYPDLEYIIIDGGSKDHSIEIIRKYENWLAYWVSEPDEGQAHAINKGFKRASGRLVAWLNSDDSYLPQTLSCIANVFSSHPEIEMIYGDIYLIDAESAHLRLLTSHDFDKEKGIRLTFVPQPASFWRMILFEKVGHLNESYHYIFDLEYWVRVSLICRMMYIKSPLANFRVHEKAKTQAYQISTTLEGLLLYKRLFSDPRTPKHILKFKRDELRHWYERLGLNYVDEGLRAKACLSFVKSILTQPWRPRSLILAARIFDTLFATHLAERKSFWRKLKKLFSHGTQEDLAHGTSFCSKMKGH